jgi:hypothetical protein
MHAVVDVCVGAENAETVGEILQSKIRIKSDDSLSLAAIAILLTLFICKC